MRYNANILPTCVVVTQLLNSALALPVLTREECGVADTQSLYKRDADAHLDFPQVIANFDGEAETKGIQKRGLEKRTLYSFVQNLLCGTKKTKEDARIDSSEVVQNTGASQQNVIAPETAIEETKEQEVPGGMSMSTSYEVISGPQGQNANPPSSLQQDIVAPLTANRNRQASIRPPNKIQNNPTFQQLTENVIPIQEDPADLLSSTASASKFTKNDAAALLGMYLYNVDFTDVLNKINPPRGTNTNGYDQLREAGRNAPPKPGFLKRLLGGARNPSDKYLAGPTAPYQNALSLGPPLVDNIIENPNWVINPTSDNRLSNIVQEQLDENKRILKTKADAREREKLRQAQHEQRLDEFAKWKQIQTGSIEEDLRRERLYDELYVDSEAGSDIGEEQTHTITVSANANQNAVPDDQNPGNLLEQSGNIMQESVDPLTVARIFNPLDQAQVFKAPSGGINSQVDEVPYINPQLAGAQLLQAPSGGISSQDNEVPYTNPALQGAQILKAPSGGISPQIEEVPASVNNQGQVASERTSTVYQSFENNQEPPSFQDDNFLVNGDDTANFKGNLMGESGGFLSGSQVLGNLGLSQIKPSGANNLVVSQIQPFGSNPGQSQIRPSGGQYTPSVVREEVSFSESDQADLQGDDSRGYDELEESTYVLESELPANVQAANVQASNLQNVGANNMGFSFSNPAGGSNNNNNNNNNGAAGPGGQ
ncbi:hypothetical protein ABW20_dc0110141 [Dactylellina cionopaga]|nr:hypothetical protein ABW20_dc0110141 [Dactylellina cionopaga]